MIYNVSRPVILLKLIKIGKLPENAYYKRLKKWIDQYPYQKQKESSIIQSGGGNYYNTQLTYLGVKYANLAFEKYRQEFISIEELADHLNVKVRNLEELEDRLYRKTKCTKYTKCV